MALRFRSFARRASVVVLTLTIGVLLAVATSGQAHAGSPERAPAPKALLDDLASINKKLAKLTRQEVDGRGDLGELGRGISGVVADLNHLKNDHFDFTTNYGITGRALLGDVSCVDQAVSYVHGVVREERDHLFESPLSHQQGLRGARRCIEELEESLSRATSINDPNHPPPGLFRELGDLGSAVRDLEDACGCGKKDFDFAKFKRKADAVHDGKRKLVRRWFTQPIYDVPGPDVTLGYDCVMDALAEAAGVADQAAKHKFTSDVRRDAFKLIAAAKKCKDSLEEALKAASEGSPATPAGPARYTLSGTLHMSWQWPPDPNTGNRQTASFTVNSATACGTGPPSGLTWQLSTSAGPTSAPFASSNPALVHVSRFGTEATVRGHLRYRTASTDTITLEGSKEGDVIGPSVDQPTANVVRSAVSSC